MISRQRTTEQTLKELDAALPVLHDSDNAWPMIECFRLRRSPADWLPVPQCAKDEQRKERE